MARHALTLAAIGVASLFAVVWWLQRPDAPMDKGISLSLAEARRARVSALKYALHLQIPGDRRQPVRGRLTATFALSDAGSPLPFDFAQPVDHLLRVVANDGLITPQINEGHVVLPPAYLHRGNNVISFDFLAGADALHRDDEFVYSLFVPARASTVVPCFDQPDLKARWELTLDVPQGWTAVSNGREIGRTGAPDATSVIFEETQPISTYLFAVAAGKFSVETAERRGRTIRMFHRETDRAKVDRNRDAMMDLHSGALTWLEDYTGIPFPFGKFDFVLIPSFQFSGMEHPGAVYYNASTVMLDETATQQQHLARANVIAHETAHMWFGNLVTMKWFNDVWMKEVFANFMAAKIVNPSFPEVNHDLRFLWQHYPAAYEVDRTAGANPIRQPLGSLSEAGSLYGAIIYQKAPIVMRQLERLIGTDSLRQGLREYLATYSMGNATWPDLIDVLSRRSATDLGAWSRAWVDEPGRPTVATELQVADGVITRLAFHQTDPRSRDIQWPQQLEVVVGSRRGVHVLAVDLMGADVLVPGAVGLRADWVLPVGRGLGYARFDLDPRTLGFVAGSLHTLSDPTTRGAALIVLWESMLEGRVSPNRVWRQIVAALPVERDELNVQQLIDYARTVFWRVIPPDDRPAAAAEVEPVLRAGLDRARTTSAKAMWFGGLRSLASSPATVDWLARIWRREASVPGLPLSESDEIELAFELAVRDVATTESILTTELDRIENADRKARFAFVMPALSRDVSVRDRFFDSLRDPANRSREAWVLEAVKYLHHPLRVGTSGKHVRAALQLVRELQQTGDIFFPKRWVDATLAGHQSIQTATDVRAFIDGLPADYPPRLRWVLLASADLLFRHLDGRLGGPDRADGEVGAAGRP